MSPAESTRLSPAYYGAVDELRRNKKQREVYESTGNCAALAGPGSGKTKVLTAKVARMLTEDVDPPQGVACITFSTECARELRTRLAALGIREEARVFIGTAHGFCLQHVLRPYARIAGAGLPDPIMVANLRHQTSALQQAMDEGLPYPAEPSSYRISLDRYRRTYLDRSHASWAEGDEHLPLVIERYEQLLRREGLIDFDDMVLVGLRLLKEHQWIRAALRCRFPILVVDEYQDLGPALDQIVRALMATGVRILAVGDPDQSIYGFTGADPRLLETLASLDEVNEVRLRLNYRSRKAIVDGALIVLREMRDYEAASDEEGEEGIIDFVECPDGLEQQGAIILDRLVPEVVARRDQRRLGDVAILYPDKNVGAVVAAAAEERKVPVIRIDQGAPYRRTPLTRWLEDCASWCAGGWLRGEPALSTILAWWTNFTASGISDDRRWQAKIDLVGPLWHNRDPEARLAAWLDRIYDAVLKRALTADNEHQDEIEVWEELCLACEDEGRLAQWTVEMFGRQGGSPDHLNLITLHSAKGLEFDAVVMMGMDQGIIPRWGLDTEEAKRESRRLFYVGMTRARHEVHLTYSGFTVNQYGRRFDNGPSEYVLELQDRAK